MACLCVCVCVCVCVCSAWGVAYAACAVGAKLVLPGPFLDGKSLYDIVMSEQVSFACAVPTVYLGLFEYLDSAHINSLGPLQRTVIGGAAPPRAMVKRLQQELHVRVLQGWLDRMRPIARCCFWQNEDASLS